MPWGQEKACKSSRVINRVDGFERRPKLIEEERDV
jgi:hypothetical protein